MGKHKKCCNPFRKKSCLNRRKLRRISKSDILNAKLKNVSLVNDSFLCVQCYFYLKQHDAEESKHYFDKVSEESDESSETNNQNGAENHSDNDFSEQTIHFKGPELIFKNYLS